MASHETGKAGKEKELGKGKKGGFFSRLFGSKKVKKEDDPN